MTGDKTYAEMPRFATADGAGTNDESSARKDDKSGRPVDNPKRQIWITSTALQSALNMSYFAENIAVFVIAMGVALLLTGIGFIILTMGALRRADHHAGMTAGPALAG